MSIQNDNLSYIAHYTTPTQGENSIELSPEHRAILDTLRASCALMDAIYGLTWKLFPSRYEVWYKAA